MPRDGSNVYSKPSGTTAVAGTTIQSSVFNSVVDDLVTDANTDRPITAGGTGASNASSARTNLGLGNVENTADADKPVSTAQQTALDGKANSSHTHSADAITIGNLPVSRMDKATQAEVQAGTADVGVVDPERLVQGIDHHRPNNLVFNYVDTVSTYTGTDIQITALNTSITTTRDNARVLIEAVINLEHHGNGVVYMERGGTEIGSGTTSGTGNRNVGMAPIAWDGGDVGTTGNQVILRYLDTITTAGLTSYTFHVRSSTDYTTALNRTLSDLDVNVYERFASSVMLTELPPA